MILGSTGLVFGSVGPLKQFDNSNYVNLIDQVEKVENDKTTRTRELYVQVLRRRWPGARQIVTINDDCVDYGIGDGRS